MTDTYLSLTRDNYVQKDSKIAQNHKRMKLIKTDQEQIEMSPCLLILIQSFN